MFTARIPDTEITNLPYVDLRVIPTFGWGTRDSSLKLIGNLLMFERQEEEESAIRQIHIDTINSRTWFYGLLKNEYSPLENTIYIANHSSLYESSLNKHKDYKKMQVLEAYMNQVTERESCIFINENKKCVFVFIEEDRKTATLYHALASILPKLLPWLFIENPLTDYEKEVLKALVGEDMSEFIELVHKNPRMEELKKNKIQKEMSECFVNVINGKIQSLQSNLKSYERRIEDNLRSYKELLNLKVSANDSLEILMTKKDAAKEQGEKLIKYILKSGWLAIHDINSYDGLLFEVNTYLGNYDIESAKSIYNSSQSLLYTASYCQDSPSKKVIKEIFKRIFLTNDVIIPIRGVFRLNFANNGISAISRSSHYEVNYNTIFANPHLKYHGCLGQYSRKMIEEATKMNYELVFDLCLASTQNLNFGDRVVLNEALRDIFNLGNRFLRIKGVDKPMNAQEAYDYFLEKEGENNE